MIALVIGASGATGRDLVNQLLKDTLFDEVHVFVRKSYDLSHPKLKAHIVDFDKPESWGHLVKGDVAFSCMGTTLKAAGSKAAQWKIDHDYQYNFAKMASENKVANYVLVSAYGANSKSSIFYNKMKGTLEEEIEKLTFTKTIIFRPGMLKRKNTQRFGEKFTEKILGFLNTLGFLKKYKPLPTQVLAKAMINALQIQPKGISMISLNEIFEVEQS